MTRTVRDVAALINDTMPLSKAADWDPVGLQVGDPAADVRTVGVVHEVNDAVLRHLDETPVDMVVAYHPLLFRKTNRLVADTGPAGRAYRLARNGVALAVVHTAFDVADGGTADALAHELGLSAPAGIGPLWSSPAAKVVVFAPEADADRVAEAMAAEGAGRIGAYSACSFRTGGTGTFRAPATASPATGTAGEYNREPEVRIEMITPVSRIDAVVAALVAAHRYEEPAYDVYDVRANAGFVGRVGRLETAVTLQTFARRVGERLDTPVRVAGAASRDVAQVAVIPGSGASFIDQVVGAADVLVTGDVSHHQAVAALDRGLAVIDAGHAPTERPGLRALYSLVSAAGMDTVDMTIIDANPWKEW